KRSQLAEASARARRRRRAVGRRPPSSADFSEGSQAPPRLPLASRFGPRPQSVGGRPAQVQSSSLQSNWQEGKRRWEGYRTKKIRSAETPQVSALRSHALALLPHVTNKTLDQIPSSAGPSEHW